MENEKRDEHEPQGPKDQDDHGDPQPNTQGEGEPPTNPGDVPGPGKEGGG